MKKETRMIEIIEAAKTSHNTEVKQALEKLLFTVSMANSKAYIEDANSYHVPSGCTISIPKSEQDITMSLVWNDEEMAVRTMEHCYMQFTYGHLLNKDDPLPGVYLIEDRNYNA